MSRSDRDATATPAAAAPRGDTFPEGPYPWMVRSGPVPASVSGGMRTVDPGPADASNRLEELEPPYLVTCAAAVIQQMELAWESAPLSRFLLGVMLGGP
jgi:hypothetical protein